MTHEQLLETIEEITIQIVIAKKQLQKIVYLSGKVTGLEPLVVEEKFAMDELALKNKGYWVFNPTEFIDIDCNWQMAMRLCLAILPMCEVVFKQPDWVDSDGAKWENENAMRLGLMTVAL
jgi:hypothetical protein